MNDPKAISDALRADFPANLIERKDNKSYIGHEHIRERVIEATGNVFDWIVTSEEYRMDGTNHQVENKRTKQMYTPIVHRVNGVLTIPGLGSRHGTGVQALQEGAGEDTYKAAESDAFKRAAMAFGVALQLYVNGPSERESSTQQHAPAAQSQPATADATTSGADAEQMRAIGMLIKAKFGNKPDAAKIKEWMHSVTGKSSRDEMTAADADTFIAWLTAYQPEPPR